MVLRNCSGVVADASDKRLPEIARACLAALGAQRFRIGGRTSLDAASNCLRGAPRLHTVASRYIRHRGSPRSWTLVEAARELYRGDPVISLATFSAIGFQVRCWPMANSVTCSGVIACV